MVSAAYMRGPLHFLLQSSGGQWLLLGFGAFTLFPDKVQEIVRLALERLSAGSSPSSNNYPRLPSSQNAPIIIHTGHDKGDARSMLNIAMYILSAAGIWVSYSALR